MSNLKEKIMAAVAKRNRRWLIDEGAKALKGEPQATMIIGQSMVELHNAHEAEGLALFITTLHRAFPPALVPMITDMARLMRNMGKLREAIEIYRVALHYAPKNAEMLHHAGLCRQQLGEYDEARKLYRESLAVEPGMALNRMALAQMDMIERGVAAGIEGYEARFEAEPEQWRMLPFPRWKGEALAEKSIVLWAEQGVGDVINFATPLPYVFGQSPAKVTLCVPPKLLDLFARSFPQAQVMGLNAIHALPPHDYSAPMGDLLRYCLPHYTPAEHPPIFKANAEEAAVMRGKLAAMGNARRIGFAWCTTNTKSANVRDIPLEAWLPIFSTPGCAFFSLQHGEGVVQAVHQLQQATGLPVFADAGFDPSASIDGLATVVSCMDEVITIQNAVAHVSGGLGVPATLMLPYCSEFRWGLKRSDNIWYASVHVERQSEPLVWDDCIARVAEGLRGRAAVAA